MFVLPIDNHLFQNSLEFATIVKTYHAIHHMIAYHYDINQVQPMYKNHQKIRVYMISLAKQKLQDEKKKEKKIII